ncbi:MAG: hypothetical protein ACRDLL_12275 [Solirubrobacterales bacterium]
MEARTVDNWSTRLRGDWRAVKALYAQLTALKRAAGEGGEKTPPPANDISNRLAEAIAQVFALYESMEEEFLDHLREVMLEIDGVGWTDEDRFRNLCVDEELQRLDLFSKARVDARPCPFEAAVETMRRIQDLNSVRSALSPQQTTAILGGSMSFGRFFTVKGHYTRRPSDIDLVVVVRNYKDLTGKLPKALRSVRDVHGEEFIQQASLSAFAERAEIFCGSLANDNQPTVFQHKLKLWEGAKSSYFEPYQLPLNYKLAIHVVSLADFKHLILHDLTRLSEIPEGEPRAVRVYRDDEPPKAREDQYCFAGLHRTSPVESHPMGGGFLTTIQVCEKTEGRFYPGMHLNLILPQFEVRWESERLPLRLPLQALRYKMLARLEDERQERPREVQRLSFAHARSKRFARRVTQRLDGG